VVDAQTGAWLQNVPDPGGRQAVALAENNHVFTPVRVTPAMVKDPSTDNTTARSLGSRELAASLFSFTPTTRIGRSI